MRLMFAPYRFRYLFLFFLLVGITNVEAKKSNSSLVNLFIGTSGDNGQVDPGAAVPFGMVRVCPDSEPRSHAGYDFSLTKVSGISVNRLSGVGCSGAGGNFSIKPSEPNFDLRIVKQTEKATPGYYATTFNNGVKAELTATKNIAVERYSFPKDSEALVTFNLGASFEPIIEENHQWVSNTELEGVVVAANVCGRGKYKLYFNLKADQPFTVINDIDHKILLSFGKSKGKSVELRIAVSSVSAAAARKENELMESESFRQIKASTAKGWEQKLSRVTVKGGSPDDRTIFYTSLYRTYLSPANVTTSDGQYLGTDGEIHQTNGFDYYSSWSLWDTFRTKFPLLVLLEPTAMSDMSQSLVRLYQSGKANWSTESEATPTVRTEHAVILLLDAYRKEIKGIDFRVCYPQLCKEAAELPLNSPDQKLESSTDLWALAQIADIIGQKEDALKYRKQSEDLFANTWKMYFMNVDSNYSKMRDNGLYQGTRWQYRWAVPQYLDKMKAWCGIDTLRKQLDYFFVNHLFNQGNEPDIHVPFLYNQLGATDKTQQRVYALLTKEIIHKYGGNAEFKTPYVGRGFKNEPEGYMPEMDEDDGTMGAWYAFSTMGLYPLTVGKPEYEITSPQFDKITLKLENGKTFSIKTTNRKSLSDPVKGLRLNKQPYALWQLTHDVVLQGGELEFVY